LHSGCADFGIDRWGELIGHQCQAFAREVIDDRQEAEATAIG
jgi:hypothetical protein